MAWHWQGNRLGIDPDKPLPTVHSRTALLMPTYNEDPRRLLAGLQAIYESVAATGLLPGTYRTGGPLAVDLAGLGVGAERPDGTFAAAWADLGTDAIRRERRAAVVEASPNRARDAAGHSSHRKR